MGWLLALVTLAALGGLWWGRRRRLGRQRELLLLCDRAGLRFAPLDLRPDTAWLPFPMFGRSPSGTENVVWDEREGEDTQVFDFWYRDATDERPVTARRRLTCAAIRLPGTCPGLRVAPRGLVQDVVGTPGRTEVELELEAFSRRFRVEAEDPRFAVAFLDQRMMEAFLTLPEDVTAEANEDVLLLWAPLLPAPRVLLLLVAASRLRRAVPRVITSLYPPRPAQGAHERRWLQGRWSPNPTGADVSPHGA